MKLTTKLLSILIAGVIVLLAVDGYLSVRREADFFENEMRRDAVLLGIALRDATRELWRAENYEGVEKLLDEITRSEQVLSVRWVWLDGHADDHAPRAALSDLDALRRGQTVTLAGPEIGAGPYLFSYVPVSVPSGRPGALELAQSMEPARAYTRSTAIRVLVLTLVMVAVSAIVGLVFGVLLVGRPLHRLVEKTARIGRGDLSEPLQLAGHNELSELADATNHMCEQLSLSRERLLRETEAKLAAIEQLRHADRLRTVGRLASGIAHEVGTPLNVISGRAELILTEDLSAAERRESASIIRSQCEKITRTVRRLLDFGRRPSPEKREVDLGRIARKTIDLLAPLGAKRGIAIRLVDDGSSGRIEADPGQVEQVLANLVMNAIQAMTESGEIEVTVFRGRARHPEDADGPEAEYAGISIKDRGPGIPDDVRPHLFEPFYTTKDVGEGTGLGLSIVYGIVSEHGGWIDVASGPDGGSVFTVRLPAEKKS